MPSTLDRRDLKQRIIDIMTTITEIDTVYYLQPQQVLEDNRVIGYVNYVSSTRDRRQDFRTVYRTIIFEIGIMSGQQVERNYEDQNRERVLNAVDATYSAFGSRPFLQLTPDGEWYDGVTSITNDDAVRITDDTLTVPGDYDNIQATLALEIDFADRKC